MAAPVKLYGPPLSTAVCRVLACFIEKDVEFQLIPVNMSKGEHKSPDYLKIQPFGQVPAFQDKSITLFANTLFPMLFFLCLINQESRAICRYICDKYANQGNKGLYGTNLLARASIDQWIEAEGQSFNPPISSLVFQLVLAVWMKIKRDENLIKQSEEKLSKVLDVYEKRLGDYRYLAGDEFTFADLSHLPYA